MTVMIALLQGVNVGTSGRVSMREIRDAALSCGCQGVQTYRQSGNLVFRTGNHDPASLARELQSAIAASTSVEPRVLVRTGDELNAVIAANPFSSNAVDPTQLHAIFFPDESRSVLGGLDLDGFDPEQAAVVGREVFLFLPAGLGASRLAGALTRRTGSVGTQRNWRTVTALAELAKNQQ